jgi:chemotaxis protein MotB
MPRTGERGPTETGIEVYPRLPIPKAGRRESDPVMPGGRKPGLDKKLIAGVGGTLVAGVVLGFVLRPVLTTDSRVGPLEDKVADATKTADANKARADELDKSLGKLKLEKLAAEEKLMEATKAQKELAGKVAEAEVKAKEQADVSAKLQASVDKTIGQVSADGEEITLRLVDKVMFKTLDDQMTDQGKKVLDKVAIALKELPDKQIWVQGHTDDQPIFRPPTPKAPPPKKGQKPAPVEPPPAPKFATNWELSAARALTVVHYLQDVAKVEPSRLAALAFGQYRPVSRTNKAANRRIEIVLYPKPIVKK